MPTGPYRSHVAALALLSILASLPACDRAQPPSAGDQAAGSRASAPANSELTSELETFERQAENCTGDQECASVSVTREVFAQRPALNRAVMRRLLVQLRGESEGGNEGAAGNLEEIARQFLAEAAEVAEVSSAGWLLSGEARRLDRRGNLLTVEINSYRYTGGAHGMPSVEWFNWDLAADKHIPLRELIAGGAEQVFWERAREAHGRWLEQQSEMDPGSGEIWPFQRTGNFRFGDDGLVLLYDVYALGPYAMGPVKLTIPWQELRGVIDDRFLPPQ
ncbi:DUF3298 and DUF4163 domain-containing protein [Microbulbifer yueqingensis]|uniref:DUF3298 domain-containing protein n=1 Tax=Microbulbifer yueqingensis TaxID=658219 RepID=A0A1G9CR99_9GAMM|nr:DUF3298 and DUF4163 domain-containing protein [Microbulbifer yueqingensis]SDK54138.1 Protein of unknown function [Microbulbifer yueqingensis]